MTERLTIATRGSRLARAQSQWVADELHRKHPELDVELVVVETRGDVMLDRRVEQIGKGAFVREVQAAVLDGRADLAVHSYKDLPVEDVPGLRVAAVPVRADPRDALISHSRRPFLFLPEGAVIGTSSRRRAAQILRRRSDLEVRPIRGNVDTRLRKLDEGDYDALVLAMAGLIRLGRKDDVTEPIDTRQMIPAAGQGALALEIREEDDATARLLEAIHDEMTAFAVLAERTCLARLGGGCSAPIGVYAVTDGDQMFIHGFAGDEGGERASRLRWMGPVREAEEVGTTLAELMLAAGADRFVPGRPPGSTALPGTPPGPDFDR